MTTDEAREVKGMPGELVLLSNGEYNDYGVIGLFRVLKEINAEVLVPIAEALQDDTERYDSLADVVRVLLAQEYLEMVAYKEIFLGLYLNTMQLQYNDNEMTWRYASEDTDADAETPLREP